MGLSPIRPGGAVGAGLFLIGLLILAGVGIYYGYTFHSRTQLDHLNASIEGPVLLSRTAIEAGFSPTEPREHRTIAEITEVSPPSTRVTPKDMDRSQNLVRVPEDQRPVLQKSPGDSLSIGPLYSMAYPAYQMHPKYWNQPLWAGIDMRETTVLPDGFRLSLTHEADDRSRPRRIRIPVIDVDSEIKELDITDLEDSKTFETPKHVVGHIPGTADPGEQGNGWFFGHLESPIMGEGNVFRNLPQIPQQLNDGDPVYIILESGHGEHLYQVTETLWVHQDDLRLYDSQESSITLVTCYPRLVYDHRLLVTAKLVGVKN